MRSLLFFFQLVPYYFLSQNAIVSDGIHSPLGLPLNVSSFFGDIRPNHFHMGMDFRTNGVEGIPIYSIREGYVSRIRISRDGYGKVLYVNHPNGQTSVYAHCSKFFGKVDSAVVQWQIQHQQNEIDITLDAFTLPVIKGQQIAYSGNSGNSTGPHLHFEIRETLSETALNPLNHGFRLIDDFAPFIETIKLVPISKQGFVIGNSHISVSPTLDKTKNIEALPHISLTKPTFSEAASVGLLIQGGDKMTINGNKFDIFKSEVYFNNALVYRCVMDSISFDHTCYVNDYCDYQAYRINKMKWHKLFSSEGNPLHIYKLDETTDYLTKFSSQKIHVRIVVSDRNNNSNAYAFWLLPFDFNRSSEVFNTLTHFQPEQAVLGDYSTFQYTLDPFTLMQPAKKANLLNQSVPLSKAAIFQTQIPKNNPTKCFVRINGKYTKTSRDGDKIKAETKVLGIPSLAWDSIPPKISSSYLTSDTSYSKNFLKWTISDFVFIPIYYDLKSKTVTCNLKTIARGKINIRLEVEDVLNNKNIHQKTLILK